jgi:hypothetical protein
MPFSASLACGSRRPAARGQAIRCAKRPKKLLPAHCNPGLYALFPHTYLYLLSATYP